MQKFVDEPAANDKIQEKVKQARARASSDVAAKGKKGQGQGVKDESASSDADASEGKLGKGAKKGKRPRAPRERGVMLPDGFVYELGATLEWLRLRNQNSAPCTNAVLRLAPLRQVVETFMPSTCSTGATCRVRLERATRKAEEQLQTSSEVMSVVGLLRS